MQTIVVREARAAVTTALADCVPEVERAGASWRFDDLLMSYEAEDLKE